MRKRHTTALLVLFTAVTVSACGTSTEPIRPARALAPIESTSPMSATSSDALAALGRAPVAPVVVTLESTRFDKDQRIISADGGVELTLTAADDRGALIGIQVIGDEARAAIHGKDDDIHWVRWDTVVRTWEKAVQESVQDDPRPEIASLYTDDTAHAVAGGIKKSALALLSSLIEPETLLTCIAGDTAPTREPSGAWTFSCEQTATTVTVWLDDQGRATRVDTTALGVTTRGLARWDEKRTLSAATVDENFDMREAQANMEKTARALADEIDTFENADG